LALFLPEEDRFFNRLVIDAATVDGLRSPPAQLHCFFSVALILLPENGSVLFSCSASANRGYHLSRPSNE
jgi:hypothetical protein